MTADLKEARALHLAGQVDEAERRYRDILKQTPRDPDALHLLGVARFQREDYTAAIEFCRQAIAIKPDHFEAHRALINVLQAQGKLEEAETATRRAIELGPARAALQFTLGSVLQAQGKAVDAAEAYREAIRLNPDLVEARLNLGVMLQAAGRHKEALAAYREVLAAQPDNILAHFNLGVALRELRRYDEAIQSYEAAIRLKPDYVAALHALGSVQTESGNLEGAEATHRRVLQIAPDHVDSLCHLASLLQVLGRGSEAADLYRKAIDRGLEPATLTRYLALSRLYNPDDGTGSHHAEQSRTETIVARISRGLTAVHTNRRDPERRIKIGYLSSDFRIHPVARNLELLLQNRDRSRFEVFAYADVPKPDVGTEKLKEMVDGWRDIAGWDDERIAGLVRSDGIDILLILAGHFDRNRPMVAAYRPAPVQISLFDAVTSGISTIDYFIADSFMVPRHSPEVFSEHVLRLPNFYLHAPLVEAPPVGPVPASISGHVTFGCFNSPTKINDRVLALWAEILKRVPNSRLVLKYLGFYGSPALRQRIEREFVRHGIDVARIEMGGVRETMGEHLENYKRIDIALDPFPFNGSTTTFEALWMGVPVVTLVGSSLMARWSGSMVRQLGLADLAARLPSEYVDIAVRLAADSDRLSGLRASLRARLAGSPLCDGRRTTRHFEQALRAAWRKWCGRSDETASEARAEVGRVRALLAAGRVDAARTAFGDLSLPERAPARAELCFELGNAYYAQHRNKDAAEWFARHLELRPGHASGHFNLGLSLQNQGRLEEAMAEYQRALQANPRLRAARENLALLLLLLARPGEAIDLYRQGLEITPAEVDFHRFLVAATFYDPSWTDAARYQEACGFDAFVRSVQPPATAPANSKKPDRRLRIGYVTSDIRDHPVGRNMEPLLVSRNRTDFETFIYAEVAQPDATTERLKSQVDGWRPTVGLSDRQVADLVKADGIDILVLLAGRFDRNRPLVAAYRPAPVQISLYDVTTSGTKAVDYLIADRTVCPRIPKEGFVERVIRLPMMYAYPVPVGAPPVGPSPFERNGQVTFGSFNNSAKLNNITLIFWATILKSTPGSRLALKFRQVFLTSAVRNRVAGTFEALEVHPGRIDFLGADDSLAQHLQRYNDVDIALDPHPFSGATTTFEALWMGVPVVTFAGTTMMSRCSASMLRALKLDQLIADAPERYVTIASELARDPARLAGLRTELRSRIAQSSLCNGPLRMRQIERAYRAVWQRWCAGRQ